MLHFSLQIWSYGGFSPWTLKRGGNSKILALKKKLLTKYAIIQELTLECMLNILESYMVLQYPTIWVYPEFMITTKEVLCSFSCKK